MNDKQKFLLKASVFAIVALTLLAWSVLSFIGGGSGFLPSLVLVIVAVFWFKFIKDKYESIRHGVPSKDERTDRIMKKAGYYSFLATIWVLLGLMWYAGTGVEELGYPEILPRHVAAVGIVASAIMFGAFYVYFSRQGDI